MWVTGTINTSLRKLRPAAEIPWVTFHDFGHYYASALIGHGLSPRAVADLLGHSTPTITLQVYTHFWDPENERARQAVSDVFGGRRGNDGKPTAGTSGQSRTGDKNPQVKAV